MDANDHKIAEFMDLLEGRTIKKIDDGVIIKESCTATLLLIFAVIDSLSKITCTDPEYALYQQKKGNRVRFTNFLENVMRGPYAQFNDRLYELRNDIVHTGINVKVAMSKEKHAPHLMEVDEELQINTSQFLDDLKETVKRIRQDIAAKGEYWQHASRRLRELAIIEEVEEPIPSPGAPEKPFQ
jgi:hypothetical protein